MQVLSKLMADDERQALADQAVRLQCYVDLVTVFQQVRRHGSNDSARRGADGPGLHVSKANASLIKGGEHKVLASNDDFPALNPRTAHDAFDHRLRHSLQNPLLCLII